MANIIRYKGHWPLGKQTKQHVFLMLESMRQSGTPACSYNLGTELPSEPQARLGSRETLCQKPNPTETRRHITMVSRTEAAAVEKCSAEILSGIVA